MGDPRRILAIDPGLSGGYALLTSDGELVDAGDLPTLGVGSRRRINGPGFDMLLDVLLPSVAIIEDVSAMPGQGVSSMFRFGRAVGCLEGVTLAKRIPLRFVSPAKWKRALGLAGKAANGAELSRQRAVERWPAKAALFARKKDHNRSEAALLGLWFIESRPAPESRRAA